jgi:hypothetical protein
VSIMLSTILLSPLNSSFVFHPCCKPTIKENPSYGGFRVVFCDKRAEIRYIKVTAVSMNCSGIMPCIEEDDQGRTFQYEN